MGFSLEHATPLRKYTLKIFHGGSISKENPYQNYINGEVVYARNLALENASLGLFMEIAKQLDYEPGCKFCYRESTNGTFADITNDDMVHDIVNHQLIADRELNVFIVDGVRKERQMEVTPTIMFWNCRGLNDLKIDELKALVLFYKPNIVFLIESRLSSTFVGKICLKLGFQDFRDSPANRHMEDLNNCVGLAMFQDRSVKLEFHNSSENYLEFIVHLSDSKRYRLLCFYGDPKNKNRSRQWLKQLSSTSIEDRLVGGGDFNFIVNPREKSGGSEKTQHKMEDTFTECNLDDLSFQGSSIFTWKGNDVRERLDRVVAASTWKELFPNYRVLHLTDKVTSDHIPILLETDSVKQESKIWNATMLSITEVERAYDKLKCDITTVFRLKTSKPDLYYDAMKLVAPHLIQLEYIAVLEKDKVTYERLVTLREVQHISALFMNSIFSRKPAGEHNPAILPQFPSHGIDEKIPLNLSEYLSQTWLLINFVPIDREERRQHIVDRITDEQVNILMTWFREVSKRDGGHIGTDISKKLKEKASMIGHAMIVYDNIISLLEKQNIKDEGAITDLFSKLVDTRTTYSYFGAYAKNDITRIVEEPLQFLLETFKWRQSKNPSQYRITDTDREEQFVVLTKQMLEAEREVVMIQNPWIKKIVKDIKSEELVKQVKEVIHHQLELLQEVGCITCSKEDGIVLSKSGDKDSKSVIDRLHKAASDALKTVSKNKKCMTYEAYKSKIREVYTKTESNKKREGGDERRGVKKSKF